MQRQPFFDFTSYPNPTQKQVILQNFFPAVTQHDSKETEPTKQIKMQLEMANFAHQYRH